MADLGFWNLAQRDPSKSRWSSPTGAVARRRVARRAPIVWCTACARSGCSRAIASRPCLPNGAAMIELYLAAAQAGWYLTPINHHLTAGEIAYIVGDCEAKAFIGARAVRRRVRRRGRRGRLPARARFAVGARAGLPPARRRSATASRRRCRRIAPPAR